MIIGNGGNDAIYGSGGFDYLFGDAGRDTIHANASIGQAEYMDGEAGDYVDINSAYYFRIDYEAYTPMAGGV